MLDGKIITNGYQGKNDKYVALYYHIYSGFL
jgi:hypothetical protein